MLQPLSSDKEELAKKILDEDARSNILSLPSNATEDIVALSDIPIMEVKEELTLEPPVTEVIELAEETVVNTASEENESEAQINSAIRFKKPKGSAYVFIQMKLDECKYPVDAYACVDTGADLTLCDSAYVIAHFGRHALTQLRPISKPPKLRSASGHNLKILGKLIVTLYLGEYEMECNVIVYEGDSSMFLLGNDSFYGRLIYDRGLFLSFADNSYPPIPIRYQLDSDKVKALMQYRVAPRSHALIQVKVTENPQLTGKEVLLTSLEDPDDVNSHQCRVETPNVIINGYTPIRNTVAVIDSLGCASVLVQNDTDDVLTILPDVEIALVDFISSEDEGFGQVSLVKDQEFTSDGQKAKWPISALKGELRDKIPSNVLVQWEKILPSGNCQVDNESEEQGVNFVHDKEERKHLLDGTGEGFPTPPAADSVHSESEAKVDPEAWLSSVEHSHMSDSDWLKLKTVLLKYSDAFSKSKTEIGCCNYFRVDLPLKPGTGYLYNKPRPLPFKHREVAAATISELLAKGVIRISKSPHATNLVVVKKKTVNGVVSHRMCVDLRQVNEHSIPNRFPNYWIDDAMAKIQGSLFRTTMDFKDAFHMLVLTEESIPVTAFYFNNVLFEYVRVPFGHVCAMNAFCCLMALLCHGYDPALYYADDLMITTKNDYKSTKEQLFDLHLDHIAGMLERIIDAGLKLVAHKCQWAYSAEKPMEWLGFTMENNLLKPQESKVAAIKDFPVPSSAKQAISFVSTASFYRRFIKSFAKEVQPMYTAANKEPFVWTDEAQKAFERLKEIMCSDLILRLPRQGEPFQLYSDASAGAIGVVLCQIDPVDKKSHPCAFGSRKFNDCEMKLSIPCKELLAIVYGLNLWSFYICGNPVQVFSDCRAWTFLKVQCGASGKISRLALLVSEYDITISYVKGTQNKAADGLSRAFDDGTVKYDDQITARHPALNSLGAPSLVEGEALKLTDYLDKCDDYINTHWPKILKEYEEQQLALGKVVDSEVLKSRIKEQKLNKEEKDILGEAEFVNSAIHEAAILHVDRVRVGDWTKRFGNDGIYPFEVVKDYVSVDTNSTPEEVEELSEESDVSSDISDTESTRTTDSSVRTANYNVRLIAINESCFTLAAYAEMQRQDDFCSGKIDLIKKKDTRTKDSGYFLKRNVLMRLMRTRDMQEYNVICVPSALVKPLLESTHRSLLSGHFGSQRYYLNMTRKYYWPGMKDDIIDFHHHCLPCQYNDKFPVKYVSGHVIRPLWPMHIVHCDLIVGLPRALDGSYAILLLYDGFSRFTFGIPLSSEKADYVVNKLMSHFVAAFGLPWALHSDNGRNVDGALIRHLSLMLGVLKTSTPPHTPNANPTETMCGAVGMLLRKALNDSDKRYWSLCLPFILNSLNSTIHTATGYTPNSLFFGRYKERDLVPLIPFDAESANVNEYFKKMRRFQELAFQIVRSRNERKLEARKVHWDVTARTHHYKEGDFVLVKNKNPASGPGKKKLRAIYIGPFRVLKAYTASLIVVPWTENSRLEDYYKDPDMFRLMHRGDIKPFYTRQVSVKHCKPFYGKIEVEDIVDPIMLTRFLDSLGVDSHDELLSQIDQPPEDGDSIDTWSTGPSDPDLGPGPGAPPPPPPRDGGDEPPPPQGGEDGDDDEGPPDEGPPPHNPPSDGSENSDGAPDLNQPPGGQQGEQPMGDAQPPEGDADEPHDEGPADLGPPLDLAHDIPVREQKKRRVARSIASEFQSTLDDTILDNIEASPSVKRQIRRYRRYQEDAVDMRLTALAHDRRVNELEQLMRSTDPMVRLRAEIELKKALEQIKVDLKQSKQLVLDSDDSDDTIDDDVEESNPTDDEEHFTSISGHSEPGDQNDAPDLEWDDEIQDAQGEPVAGPSQRIRIRAPNVEIDIEPANLPRVRPTPSVRSKTRRNVTEWVSKHSPQFRADRDKAKSIPVGTPTVTRSGRHTRPPSRYSDFVQLRSTKGSAKFKKDNESVKSSVRKSRSGTKLNERQSEERGKTPDTPDNDALAEDPPADW